MIDWRNPGTGVVTDSYAYPATSNRLDTVTLGAGGSRVFTYDGIGNVTNEARTGGAYSYTYDSAGRMASFSIGGVLQASYKYDFAGRQVVRALTSPTAVTIHSVFDSDGNRIAEYDEATGALIREYVWLNGEPLAVIEGGAINYVRVDYIGRPVFATNSAGTKTWTASYLPFGEVLTTTGTPIALRFPGQWFQSESGLHQNWMRDYDPTTGRYIEADPLGLVDGASVYGYARQSPINLIDPTGEFIPVLVGIILGLIIDEIVEEVEEFCNCQDASDFNKYAVVGGVYGATGPFESKPRTGVAGGGRSGNRTSVWSSTFGSTKGTGRYARKAGRAAGRAAPLIGGAMAL